MRPALLLSLVPLLAAAGCEDVRTGESDAASLAGPLLEVGGGAETFIELHDGDPIPIETAGQGGYHVFVSVRCRGLLPDRAIVRYSLGNAESDDLYTTPDLRLRVDLLPSDGWFGRPGLFAFLSRPPGAISGRAAVLWSSVTDTDGRSAEARVTVVPESGE